MEDNSLRLVLLAVGVAILAAIYFYDAVKKKLRVDVEQDDDGLENEKVEPVISNSSSFSAVYADAKPEVEKVVEPELIKTDTKVEHNRGLHEEVPVAQQALVIQLVILPKAGESFSGTVLLDAFTALNLEFGDMGIFHCYERHNGVEIKHFHVANLLEPGTFPVGNMSDFESTGIVLFFQTNDAVDSESVFDGMLNTARELSQLFDATLAGSNMKELTLDDIASIQSQVAGLSNL